MCSMKMFSEYKNWVNAIQTCKGIKILKNTFTSPTLRSISGNINKKEVIGQTSTKLPGSNVVQVTSFVRPIRIESRSIF